MRPSVVTGGAKWTKQRGKLLNYHKFIYVAHIQQFGGQIILTIIETRDNPVEYDKIFLNPNLNTPMNNVTDCLKMYFRECQQLRRWAKVLYVFYLNGVMIIIFSNFYFTWFGGGWGVKGAGCCSYCRRNYRAGRAEASGLPPGQDQDRVALFWARPWRHRDRHLLHRQAHVVAAQSCHQRQYLPFMSHSLSTSSAGKHSQLRNRHKLELSSIGRHRVFSRKIERNCV